MFPQGEHETAVKQPTSLYDDEASPSARQHCDESGTSSPGAAAQLTAVADNGANVPRGSPSAEEDFTPRSGYGQDGGRRSINATPRSQNDEGSNGPYVNPYSPRVLTGTSVAAAAAAAVEDGHENSGRAELGDAVMTTTSVGSCRADDDLTSVKRHSIPSSVSGAAAATALYENNPRSARSSNAASPVGAASPARSATPVHVAMANSGRNSPAGGGGVASSPRRLSSSPAPVQTGNAVKTAKLPNSTGTR